VYAVYESCRRHYIQKYTAATNSTVINKTVKINVYVNQKTKIDAQEHTEDTYSKTLLSPHFDFRS